MSETVYRLNMEQLSKIIMAVCIAAGRLKSREVGNLNKSIHAIGLLDLECR